MGFLTGIIRAGLTGTADDYEADVSDGCQDYVGKKMLELCANAGQESLINSAIEDMDVSCLIYVDFDGEIDADVNPELYINIPTKHPEAVGKIIEVGYKEAENFAVNLAERYYQGYFTI